jgi:tetratricopeptide (TPR) repeat protein
MRPVVGGACACLVAAALVTGCAPRRGPLVAGPAGPARASDSHPPAPASLEEYIARVRDLTAEARAARPPRPLRLVELTDARLREAIARLGTEPTGPRHHEVAAAYLEAGIRDRAFDHLRAAARLDPSDAAAWDGMARIWRDWGLSRLGLADAHRAVFFRPDSPAARNTLGTLLHTLGSYAEARRAYEQALALDAGAAYALANLCSLDLTEHRPADAAARCRAALALDATLGQARVNLVAALDRIAPDPAPPDTEVRARTTGPDLAMPRGTTDDEEEDALPHTTSSEAPSRPHDGPRSIARVEPAPEPATGAGRRLLMPTAGRVPSLAALARRGAR